MIKFNRTIISLCAVCAMRSIILKIDPLGSSRAHMFSA